MNLAILITGGTLDKVHDTLTESLILKGKSQVGRVLKRGRMAEENKGGPRLEQLMQIDSLDMTDAHRAQILEAVTRAPEPQIVITHGTGTMELTAQYLEGRVGDKTVVLTGAMRPFSLGQSDANFNLGGAVIAAQTLPAGVYGVMNGRVFAAKQLHKDVTTGRFDTLST